MYVSSKVSILLQILNKLIDIISEAWKGMENKSSVSSNTMSSAFCVLSLNATSPQKSYTESIVEARIRYTLSRPCLSNNSRRITIGITVIQEISDAGITLGDLKTPIIQLCEAYSSSMACNIVPPWDKRYVSSIL